jgi:benzodiazapine receptor
MDGTFSRPPVVLALFLAIVVGGGLAIGFVTRPDAWYAALVKPSFNPPNWLFGPVWTTLYVMIAVAGWRVWRGGDSAALRLWWVQLALNFAWSPAFFAMRNIGLALIIVLLLLLTIALFVRYAWGRDRTAALLFLPYAAWVSFASLLNAAIYLLN